MVFVPRDTKENDDAIFAAFADVDSIVFDVDGVLIDVRESFPFAIKSCVERTWARSFGEADAAGYTTAHNEVLKLHGSFNDDYDIAWIMLNIAASRRCGRDDAALSSVMPSADELRALVSSCKGDCREWLRSTFDEAFVLDDVRSTCEKIYFGDGEPGAYKREIPMLRVDWKDLPLPPYIYTGRDLAEWELAKDVLKWHDFPTERVVHSKSGMTKPSPAGLEYICKTFGAERPVFFGDTMSDKRAADAFGRCVFVGIGDLIANDAKISCRDIERAIEILRRVKRLERP